MASTWSHADETLRNLHDDPWRAHQNTRNFDERTYQKNLSCWLGLVQCCCCEWRRKHSSQDSWSNHERVGRHIATIFADIFDGRVQGVKAWFVGLRAIWKCNKAGDEQRFQINFGSLGKSERVVMMDGVVDLGRQPPFGGHHLLEGCLEDPLLALEVSQVLAHFSRFANAAYALRIYPFTNPLTTCSSFLFGCGYLPCCKMSRDIAFQKMTGISTGDLLYRTSRATPFKPIWWLCRDTCSDALVIAVRGTFDPHDFITDLVATQTEYRGHLLHLGMLESAENVYKEVVAELPKYAGHLKSLSGDGGSPGIVVVGHSLGGSVAALLAWMLREPSQDGLNNFGPVDAVAFTYGAPPFGDEELAERMKKFVINVIHNKDVLPCLSIAMAKHVRDSVLKETAPRLWNLYRLEQTLHAFDLPSDPEELRETLEQWDTERHSGSPQSAPFHDAAGHGHELPTRDMLNAGWQIHLTRRWGRRCSCMEWFYPMLTLRSCVEPFLIVAQPPPPDYLRTIRPSTTMWSDHFPFAYQYVCEAYAERLQSLSKQNAPTPADALRCVVRYLGRGPNGGRGSA